MKQANGEVKSGDQAAREAQMKKDELKVSATISSLIALSGRVWREDRLDSAQVRSDSAYIQRGGSVHDPLSSEPVKHES